MKHALNHQWSEALFLEVGAEGLECCLENCLACRATEDVIIVFMKALASRASVVDSDSFIFGSIAHDFVGSP